MSSAYLTREQLLARITDRPTRDVEVPEWGGMVKIRALGMDEYWAIRDQARTGPGPNDFDEKLLAELLVLYALEEPKLEPADLSALRQSSVSAFSRIAQAVVELSGLTNQQVAAAEKALFRG